MKANSKLLLGQEELLDDPRRYKMLVGKLNYLTVTQPVIAYLVSVVSQFLSTPRTNHWNDVMNTSIFEACL